MDNGTCAALPTLIARAVEKAICGHRRDRKLLFTRQPHNWLEKLTAINKKILDFVFDLKQNALATSQYLKRAVHTVNGQQEFVGKGRGFEILRLKFILADDANQGGPGKYMLYSQTFPEREVCCISVEAERSGFDLLREHYAGVHRYIPRHVCIFFPTLMQVSRHLRLIYLYVFMYNIYVNWLEVHNSYLM